MQAWWVIGCALTAAAAAADTSVELGGDLSMLPRIESLGASFKDGGQPADPVATLVAHGWTIGRLRLFVAPNGQGGTIQDLRYTIGLAKRLKAGGMTLLLDLHYSDTWADPGHQTKPAAWADLPFDELVAMVHDYTAEALAAFAAEGVLPEMVQVGNEITPGMLWPDGKLYGGGAGATPERWDRFAKLVGAGVAAVREARNDQGEPQVMIHIDKGGNARATGQFFDRLFERGVDCDVIGLSYYPWWHGTLNDLRATLRLAAERYGKPLYVVETAFPWRERPDLRRNGGDAYPQTPEGQRYFLAALLETVAATPDDLGAGVVWWYPESVAVEGLHVWNGGATALWDDDHNALPALDVPNQLEE